MIEGTPKDWYPFIRSTKKPKRAGGAQLIHPRCKRCQRRRKSDRHVCEGGNTK